MAILYIVFACRKLEGTPTIPIPALLVNQQELRLAPLERLVFHQGKLLLWSQINNDHDLAPGLLPLL